MATEKLAYHNYEIRKEVKSEIDPEATTTKVTGMRCPHCKKELKAMRHFGEQTCLCGLHMTLHGNCLECYLPAIKQTLTH